MSTFDLFTLLTGNTSGGTWSYGPCGATGTLPSWIILNANTGLLTIDDNAAVAGSYNFSYTIQQDQTCPESCASVQLNIEKDICKSAGSYTGTPGQVTISV